MVESQKCNLFVVDNQEEQKISITIPSLFNDKERAEILRIILLKRCAIKDVEVNAENNSVIIEFESEELSQDALFNILEIVLVNFSKKPQKKEEMQKGKCAFCNDAICETVFYVEGMSCASCALYLEMILSRNEGVECATVDFSTKKGFVAGCLRKDEIVAIVERHGFQAYCK